MNVWFIVKRKKSHMLRRMMNYSVYLTRALGSGRLPGLSAPFNVVQLIFIFTLASRANNNVLQAFNNTTIEVITNYY